MAFELESDLRCTLDWGKKWLVDFNAGKTQLVSFDWSNNNGSIDVKMDGSVLEEKSSFKMLGLTFSSKLDLGSYIISIAKTASKKIGATFDVISLYTSIPWEFGLEAIDYFLTIYQEDLHSRFREEFILESVNFILKNNRLTFDSEFYLQIKGIAMGKIFTSFYANLIMGYEIKVYSIICQSYALASKHFENS